MLVTAAASNITARIFSPRCLHLSNLYLKLLGSLIFICHYFKVKFEVEKFMLIEQFTELQNY